MGFDRAGDASSDDPVGAGGDDGDPQSTPGPQATAPAESGRGGRLIRARLVGRFERPHLIVITVIVIIGLLLSGWAVLRARPVAIAAPDKPSATGQPAGHSASGQAGGPADSGSAPARASPAAEQSTPTPVIRVHVLGAVRRPGVVELPAGARVQDALQAAGGPRKRAELGDLNLARPLADGQQVFVAGRDSGDRVSEVRDPGSPTGGAPGGGAGTGSGSGSGGSSDLPGAPSAPVDLNTATLQELDDLPGVGPVTAQKILGWRDEHGSFSSVDELQEIDGIGPKTFADLAPLVTV